MNNKIEAYEVIVVVLIVIALTLAYYTLEGF